MEANKIKGEAKSLVLPSGAELTYCERGQEHEEVIITTAFYLHTFMPVVEGLAERFHVYGIIMRFDGPAEELNADGSVNWARQWGKDECDFADVLGIEKFIHVGKCHGVIPGWYTAKEHPERLECLASFFLAPHTGHPFGNQWASLLAAQDLTKLMGIAMRKPEEGLPKKMEEMRSLGPNATSPVVGQYGGFPERIWENADEVKDFLQNMSIPVGYLFGTKDPLFQDYYEDNMWAIANTRGSRTSILQGECHLMELDCAERVVEEAFVFIDQVRKGWHEEIMQG